VQQKAISGAIRLLVSGASAGLVMTATTLPLAVHAQTAGKEDAPAGTAKPSNVLPPVTVVGQSSRNTNEATLGISRLQDTVKETPKTINVVPQEIIEQQHATSLEQILKNVPGITISTGEGNGGQNGDQFRIRGLSAKGDIYVDGLRDFGAYKRDAFNTESVEVIKGPSGESFGVGNIGGLINQTTKKANLNTSTSIDQGFATDATYRTTLDSNFRLNDTTALRVNGVFQNGRVADRDHVDDDRRGVAIDFGTGLGTSTEWHLNYSYLHRSGAPDYGVPVAAGADGIYRPLTQYGVPGISSSTSYIRNTDRDTTDAHIVSSNFFTRLDNGITISNDTRFSFYERDFSSTAPAALSYANLQSLMAGRNVALSYGAGGGSSYLQRGWGVQNVLSAKGEFHTGSFRHKAMVGLDTMYQRDHRDQGTWTGRMNNQTVVNPVFYNSPNATVAYNSTRDANAIDVGVFMNDRVWLTEQISVLGSLRWDYFRSEYATSASSLGGDQGLHVLHVVLAHVSPGRHGHRRGGRRRGLGSAAERRQQRAGTRGHHRSGRQARLPGQAPGRDRCPLPDEEDQRLHGGPDHRRHHQRLLRYRRRPPHPWPGTGPERAHRRRLDGQRGLRLPERRGHVGLHRFHGGQRGAGRGASQRYAVDRVRHPPLDPAGAGSTDHRRRPAVRHRLLGGFGEYHEDAGQLLAGCHDRLQAGQVPHLPERLQSHEPPELPVVVWCRACRADLAPHVPAERRHDVLS
jgi:outer membrane receptor protein involved in Fe transport